MAFQVLTAASMKITSFSCSLFYDAFLATRLYGVDDRVKVNDDDSK
jgi:hypothetical protein